MTKVFISYSHSDELYRKELEKHLSMLKRNGYIDTWTDREITPGEVWGNTISKELLTAKIILLLISSDFLASDYCYDIEMKTAIKRHDAKEAVVIPIILRYCDWTDTPFSKLQALPLDGKPITFWEDLDKAFFNVVEGIKVAIKGLLNDNIQSTGIKFGKSAAEQLSHLRQQVFVAKDARDLKILLFEIKEFKKIYPLNFEIEELEEIVRRGLKYESSEVLQYPNSRNLEKAHPIYLQFLILLIALIGILIIIAVYISKHLL